MISFRRMDVLQAGNDQFPSLQDEFQARQGQLRAFFLPVYLYYVE